MTADENPDQSGGTGGEVAVATPMGLSLDVVDTKEELALAVPTEDTIDPEIEARASQYADQLLAVDASDVDAVDQSRSAVETMGRDLQRQAASRSEMLQQPIRELTRHSDDGGPVARGLVDLKIQVEDLDPKQIDLSPGWPTRLVGYIPGIGTPLKRYFTKFESSQTVIDAVINSLDKGRDELTRDNVTLREDQKSMRELTTKLENQSQLAMALDQKLQYKLDREIATDDTRHSFVQEELLFPLRQRTMDLQQQLAVNQQGVLATEIIIRNNRELIRGVDRALDVTISALQVAVTVALALAHQKIVLDKITMINKTTSDLIAGTAERLRTQGTEIHTQAASTMLEMDALKSAFADINAAMDEISRYRREALPQMAASIDELDELTTQGEQSIQRMEETRASAPLLELNAE
jgi:uncharacterized protein YaaN involved in tellurite resistance